MFTKTQKNFLLQLDQQLPAFLQKLSRSGRPGQFLPCQDGATDLGRQLGLGYSCFALKTYYMLGQWELFEKSAQEQWIAYLKSFQIQGLINNDAITQNAFIDRPLYDSLQPKYSLRDKLRQILKPAIKNTYQQAVVIAETKQAIASLLEAGASLQYPYLGFPKTVTGVRAFFNQQDWSKPWGAGGQSAALVVFLKTQARSAPESDSPIDLLKIPENFYSSIVDRNTGLYFRGDMAPSYDEGINGAMKVLTALDWMETPVHYPAQLINTCLSAKPQSEGCHLVDTVYVLYRCLQYTSHRKSEIQTYCAGVLELILQHHNQDGGFSYSIGKSQTGYYGAAIANGLPESDIHGTILLVWALAMLLNIQEDKFLSWKVIKP